MDKKLAEKMVAALYNVFDVCGKTKKCSGCPALGKDGVCKQFESAPYSWKIETESRNRWKTKKTWRETFEEEKQ